jgi:hypothetical protein
MHSLPASQAGLVEIACLGAADLASTTPFDLECPLMSLPALFRTTVETVPWPGAYLAADPKEAQEKFHLYPSAAENLRIGIAWAGNPHYKADHLRSTTLATFLPFLRTPNCTWFSLQKADPARQLAALPRDVSVFDASSHDRDLAETAALISTLDLVITTDTCIAHLAGAMAKPTWILLPHLADWRWMERIETTPWYPTARLFRQPQRDGWASLIDWVTAELSNWQPAQGLQTIHK